MKTRRQQKDSDKRRISCLVKHLVDKQLAAYVGTSLLSLHSGNRTQDDVVKDIMHYWYER